MWIYMLNTMTGSLLVQNVWVWLKIAKNIGLGQMIFKITLAEICASQILILTICEL